jgi:hypothetical protein
MYPFNNDNILKNRNKEAPMKEIEYSTLSNEQLSELIQSKTSFKLLGCRSEMIEVADRVEKAIEGKSLSCRVVTLGRSTAAVGVLFAGFVPGVVSLASIVAHNVSTYNPDYIVGRNLLNQSVEVEYQKK